MHSKAQAPAAMVRLTSFDGSEDGLPSEKARRSQHRDRQAKLLRLRAMLSEDALSRYAPTSETSHHPDAEVETHPTSLIQQQPWHEGNSDVCERLYAEAKRHAVFQQQARSRIEEERRNEFSFRPDTTHSKASFAFEDQVEHKPIHERVASLQRDRSVRLQQLKEMLEKEEETELTFSPAIDPRSKRITEKRRQEESMSMVVKEDAGTRLFNDGRLITFKKEMLALEHARREAESFTEPKLCAGTELIAKESALLSAEFEDRLRMYEMRQSFHRNQLQLARQRESETWFQPRIQESSRRIIQKALPEMLEEDAADRVDRLGRLAVLQREMSLRRIEDEMYADCSFSPTIDPISRALGRQPSLDELYTNHRGQRRREALQRRLEDQMKAEHTFRPKINTSFAGRETSPESNASRASVDCPVLQSRDSFEPKLAVRTPYDRTNVYLHCPELLMQRIEERRRRRDEVRESEQRLRLAQEMQQCTFQPKTRPYVKEEGAGPVVIPGLDRFLEQRELGVRLKEERAKREREVFEIDMSSFREPGSNTTIIEVRYSIIVSPPSFLISHSPSASMSRLVDLAAPSAE